MWILPKLIRNFYSGLEFGYQYASSTGTYACAHYKRLNWKYFLMHTVITPKFASTSNCLMPKCTCKVACAKYGATSNKDKDGILASDKYKDDNPV